MAVKLGRAPAEPLGSHVELSVADGWSRFLAHCERPDVLGGVSAATKKRYRAVCDKHSNFCSKVGVQNWNQVDQAHAEGYGRYLKGRAYADRSIYLELTLIKSVMKWLVGKRMVPESCRFELTLRKPLGSDTYCYTPEQVRAMLFHCHSHPNLAWLANIIRILALTGLRISELLGLRARDVDLDSGTLHIADERSSVARQNLGDLRTTKGRRGRRVPIHEGLNAVFRELLNRSTGRLFMGSQGGKLKADTVRRVFVKEVIAPLSPQFPTPAGDIGFERGRLHGFRHFFVSQAFLGGASEGEVKDWVGHRDTRMVELYRHLREQDSKLKMQQIDFLGDQDDSNCSVVGKSVDNPIASET
ncbi:MAG TPA: tyrosine-type recombinase/integrase [Planctomycetaceae bacterium]|nr:tyrosine-type recombinase/integrase [Planctomycetaceae bacterium]